MNSIFKLTKDLFKKNKIKVEDTTKEVQEITYPSQEQPEEGNYFTWYSQYSIRQQVKIKELDGITATVYGVNFDVTGTSYLVQYFIQGQKTQQTVFEEELDPLTNKTLGFRKE